MSIENSDSIYEAFCEFCMMIQLHQSQNERTSTEAYLEQDKTIKPTKAQKNQGLAGMKDGGSGKSGNQAAHAGNSLDPSGMSKKDDLDEDKSFKITRNKAASFSQ